MSTDEDVASLWAPDEFCLACDLSTPGEPAFKWAAKVYDCVCRTSFDAPGFCLVDLSALATSHSLRRTMIDLKEQLQSIHRSRTGRDLVYVSAGRFDQQTTTKPHRDGGPDESLLMLGYEPSQIDAELAMSDCSKCAHDMGLSPQEFLATYNPMFTANEKLLRPYTSRVACFSNQRHQILLINNSAASYSLKDKAWQGVLHTAMILQPNSSARRIVNSTMLASVSMGSIEPLSAADLKSFLTTTVVHRRGYDKPQVADDL